MIDVPQLLQIAEIKHVFFDVPAARNKDRFAVIRAIKNGDRVAKRDFIFVCKTSRLAVPEYFVVACKEQAKLLRPRKLFIKSKQVDRKSKDYWFALAVYPAHYLACMPAQAEYPAPELGFIL